MSITFRTLVGSVPLLLLLSYGLGGGLTLFFYSFLISYGNESGLLGFLQSTILRSVAFGSCTTHKSMIGSSVIILTTLSLLSLSVANTSESSLCCIACYWSSSSPSQMMVPWSDTVTSLGSSCMSDGSLTVCILVMVIF